MDKQMKEQEWGKPSYHPQKLAGNADANRIAARMLETLALPKPKRCICCGAPTGKVHHD